MPARPSRTRWPEQVLSAVLAVATTLGGFVPVGRAEAQDLQQDLQSVFPEPGLTNPRLRFHTGRAAKNHAELSPILPKMPGPPSAWFVVQWNKEVLLRPEAMIQAPPFRDAELGQPLYAFETQNDLSHLRIYRDPTLNEYVYQLFSRDGELNAGGGANVFLSADALPGMTFEHPITLSLEAKIDAARFIYDTPDAKVTGAVFGEFVVGFTANFHDPAMQQDTSVFMQIDIANSTGRRMDYRGCYPHNGVRLIVYGRSLDGDPWLPLHAMSGPRERMHYSVGRYLCDLIAKPFNCTEGGASPYKFTLPTSAGDLRNWAVTSIYTGLETENHDARPSAHTSAPQGTVELGVKIANLRVERDQRSVFNGHQCP